MKSDSKTQLYKRAQSQGRKRTIRNLILSLVVLGQACRWEVIASVAI